MPQKCKLSEKLWIEITSISNASLQKSSYMGIVEIGEMLYLCNPKMNVMTRLKYNFTWKRYHFTWKRYHRWFGLVMSVFMLVFCVSGIILNHREAFSNCEVSRKWLPSSYHIKNFNNGVVKGTVVKKSVAQSLSAENPDSILVYGCAGVFLTDSQLSTWQDFNAGLPESIDERNVRHLVKAKDGSLWCAALRDVYCYDENSHRWKKVELPGNEERIMDVALGKDSMLVVALTRSYVYKITILDSCRLEGKPAMAKFHVGPATVVPPPPEDYKPKTTLFKIVWHLHSGEFFGFPGKLVVDAIALALIVLSITGIILFILPYGIRKAKRLAAKARMRRLGKQFVWNMTWHNKIGYITIVLTLWIAITGMCLRPPLMVPLVMGKLPQTVGEDGNVWQDKLRAIRWDDWADCWLISTADGFVNADKDFQAFSILWPLEHTPKASPMGVTVLEPMGKGKWIVGSFRGMYHWTPKPDMEPPLTIIFKSVILDYFTGKPSEETSMIPISDNLVCGYSEDFFGGKPLVFDFAKGVEDVKGQAVDFAKLQENKNLESNRQHLYNNEPKTSKNEELMSDLICETAPMSLWNVALELHVGRCYSPFLGPFSDLFVFLSGLLITLVLLSGYIISHRRRKKVQARLK